MIYNIDQLRTLARSKDERLADKDRYPDSWIDDKIEYGFEIAESAKQVFYTAEVYDLTADIAANLPETEILLQREPHFIFELNAPDCFQVSVTANNHILVTILPTATASLVKTIEVKYFFYPTLPLVDIEMSPEIYHFFRHALYVSLYGALRDKENEAYHQSQVNTFVKKGTMGVPDEYQIEDQRFWRNTWV